MRRDTYSIRSLLIVIAFFVTSLAVSSGTASAASNYDNLIEPVSNVFVGHNGPCEGPFDLTTNWPSYVASDQLDYAGGSTARSNFRASLATALSTGTGWAVSQTRYGNAGHVNVFVHAEGYPASVTSFYTISGYQLVLMSNVYGLQISYSSSGPGDCRVYMDYNSSEAANSREIAFDQQGIYTRQPLFANTPITYPAGYEGKLFPTESPAAKYVAMGDSFSSGEGNPSFEAGTDQDGMNECHRSPQAYPRLLQGELNLQPTAFVACAGATTDNVLNGQWNEPAQVDALSEDTDVVTITIGGNDVGFAEFAKKCVSPQNTLALDEVCDEYTDIYEDTVWKINNELPDKLENVYGAILNEAENADIYVLGYPAIAPYKAINDPFDQNCGGLYDEFPNTWGDARAAHEVIGLLNYAIEDAVDAANAQYASNRLVFVPVDDGAFVGHDACSSDSYFNGIDLYDPEYSVHPNTNGHIAYKEDLSDAMS